MFWFRQNHKERKYKVTIKEVPPKIIHNENPHIKTVPDKKFTEPPTEKRYGD